MQNALKKGYVTVLDKRRMVNKKERFEDLLEKNTKDVCMEAMQKLVSLYNYMQNHDYMIVTGGTGNAWYPMIREYSNVRGYYYSLVSMLLHRFKK